MDHVDGAGTALFQRVCELDLEGIVAKLKSGPYVSDRENSTWFKIRNREYSQMVGREELFERERHREPVTRLAFLRAGVPSAGATTSGVFSITIVPQLARLQLVRKPALVVESDQDMSRSFRALLEPWGYDVSIARDGEEGLQLYEDGAPFSVVLIKLRLPKKWDWTYESQRRARWDEEYGYGVELAKQIRQRNPSQPVIIAAFSYQHEGQVSRLSELKDIPILTGMDELRGMLEKIRVYQAISSLQRADFLRLRRYAEWQVRGLNGWGWEDLLSEAIARTLEGAESNDNGRHWNNDVSFIIQLKGVMRSIASAQRRKREQSETCELPSQCNTEREEGSQFDVASDDPLMVA